MRKFVGWVGLIVVGLLGAAITVGSLYLLGRMAPNLWLLIFLALLIGGTIAYFLARPLTGWARIDRKVGQIFAAVLAILPLAGMMTAVLISPMPAYAPPGPDPRGPHQTLESPTGARIAFWTLNPDGPARKTPVIFLHGGPGGVILSRDFAIGQALRDVGFRTVYFDQAGSGASSNQPVAKYSIASAVADVDALRQKLGAEKVVLWGESWGASLAAEYARAHPDRVAATLFDSPGDFPAAPYPLDMSGTDTDGGFKPTLRDAALFLQISYAPQIAEQWQTQDQARDARRARMADVRHMYGYQCKGAKKKLERPVTAGGTNLYPQLLLMDDLHRQPKVEGTLSATPTLIVRPGCDYIPPETAALYRKAYPAAIQVDVPGRGHAFFDDDKALQTVLANFAKTRLTAIP